jgi:DNA (cytosine-5)-methyltransferase 1
MKIISLFCGCGGMDLGFIKAGHEIIWANDFDKDSCDTYYNYFQHKPVCAPIEHIKSENIPEGDVVIGGFPCQGFSIANKYRHTEDERNKLYLQLLRIINDKNPRYFVAENVKGICSLGGYESFKDKKDKKGIVLKRIISDLSKAGKFGYKVKFKVLTASDYGTPQNRQRVLILGTRKDQTKDLIHPNPLITNSKDKKTVRDAISDLPEPKGFWKKGDSPQKRIQDFYNHYGTKHKIKINGQLGNRPTEWDKPSPTITGRGGGTGGPVIIPHPNLKRRMTVREYARLQSFPDDFIFFGSTSSQFRQIGNAVPWELAYHVAKMIPKK